MSKSAIEVIDLSKKYRIDHYGKNKRNTVWDAIGNSLKHPSGFLTGDRAEHEAFWALKDVNFDVQQGDIVGIIGKNGSGKSTLLKVLSQIILPSTGLIKIQGRVASLLEVGTGFHPELTGRENIFFNGSILGMGRREINSKFHDIVEFSGVEKFLDTPVKFYSSGMYVRLAFAVAAHLEPDILIVDEVLAVGDAEFQKKSLGKMRDVTNDKKRTVIFVSHSMESVQSICNKCIWLDSGKIMQFGDTDKVIAAYTEANNALSESPLEDRKDRGGSGRMLFTSALVTDRINKDRSIFFKLNINNKTDQIFKNIKLSLGITDKSGNMLSNLTNSLIGKKIDIKPGDNVIKVKVSDISLVPGGYNFDLFAASDDYGKEVFDWVAAAGSFNVPDYDYYNIGHPPHLKGKALYMNFSYEDPIE